MSVLLGLKEKKSRNNWLRMLKAFDLISEKCDRPDAVLKAGKGWRIQSIDAQRISEALTECNIPFEKKSDYLIEIL